MPMDEQTRFQSAFAMAQTLGATTEHLMHSANHYLEILKKEGLALAGTVPADDMVYKYDLDGKPTVAIPDDNAAVQAAFEIFDKIIE